MFKRIDRSRTIARWLEWVSSTLARQRGLPVVAGVGFIAFSFVVSVVNIYVDSQILELVWSVTHHLGLIVALAGLLLVEPLGK
jgi:hypothetical protein